MEKQIFEYRKNFIHPELRVDSTIVVSNPNASSLKSVGLYHVRYVVTLVPRALYGFKVTSLKPRIKWSH